MTALQLGLAALSALTALWLVVLLVRDRPPDDAVGLGLVLLELGLVVQLVIGVVRLLGAHGDVSEATYAGYLVGGLVILPAGFLWSASERTRAGTAVLLVAVLLVPVLLLRVHDIWAAGRG